MENLIWLKVHTENEKDNLHFSVKENWLRDLFRSWLMVEVDENTLRFGSKESYINGKIDDMIENVEEYFDIDAAHDIYTEASKQNVLIESKEEFDIMEKSKWGAHESHCCVVHGCKYGDDDCPVEAKLTKQEYICESCEDDGINTLEQLEENILYKSQLGELTKDVLLCKSENMESYSIKTDYLLWLIKGKEPRDFNY